MRNEFIKRIALLLTAFVLIFTIGCSKKDNVNNESSNDSLSSGQISSDIESSQVSGSSSSESSQSQSQNNSSSNDNNDNSSNNDNNNNTSNTAGGASSHSSSSNNNNNSSSNNSSTGQTSSSIPDNSPVIKNDTFWKDTSGNEILAQGGGIIQVGDTFHWFGSEYKPGTYHLNAINHYTSKDLVNWTKQAPAVDPQASSNPFRFTNWLGRPWVLYNKPTKKYVMVLEWGSANKEGVRNRIAFLTADSINGPWVYQGVEERVPDIDGKLYSMGDLGAFQDDDGNAYILYTFDKRGTNKTQGIAKLDPNNFTKIISPAIAEFTGESREAASVVKVGDTYYYFTSKCSGWNSSQTKFRKAKSMSGPWSEANSVVTQPYSTDSYNTQHDFVLPIYGSQTTSYIYCGDRWSNYTNKGVGKYGWYPLTFDSNGRPIMHGYSSWSINVKTGVVTER